MPPIRRFADRLRRRLSIMVLSGPDSGVRHFSVPALAVPALVVLALLGTVGGGAMLLGWANDRVELARLDRLQAENERLLAQIGQIRDVVAAYEFQMDQSADLEQRFRNLANLDAIPEDVLQMGVGGPPGLSELADEAFGAPSVRTGRDLLDRIEGLERRAEFQALNLREVVAKLEKSQDELARVPSISPIRRGWFSSRYGTRLDPFTKRKTFHRGVDFSAWTGTPVYATADGRIRKAGKHGVLGKLVEIDHGNGLVTRYGHNSKILVKVGQRVRRGDKIAEVGSTGRSTSPHCHYEVHVDGRHVNPWRYILDGGPRVDREA
jgi:murein DD-endopeptidase MepM/ murein hydrolase activator NlpD